MRSFASNWIAVLALKRYKEQLKNRINNFFKKFQSALFEKSEETDWIKF
jgi:hypothetical protein